MRKAGGIVALIAGIFGVFAAGRHFTEEAAEYGAERFRQPQLARVVLLHVERGGNAALALDADRRRCAGVRAGA